MKWVKRRNFKSVKECYDTLHHEGFTIYATHLSERSKSLYELDLTKKIALVFGNEHRGVTDEAAERADVNFQVPMVGMIQSLNVSVACAVCLYEGFRQRSAAQGGSSLTHAEIDALFQEWLKK